MSERANYGIDAPGVMRNLLLAGAGGVALGLAAAQRSAAAWLSKGGWVLAALCLVPLFFGSLMLAYTLVGKTRTRDLLLNACPWTGSESVLDVGTGAGLLAVGAAKRLTTGHVVGIDLWSETDLSNNAAATAERNIRIEGVVGKATIQTGDARALAFPNRSFDRVVSLLCLHNIEAKTEQKAACAEIARVLRLGGFVLIGDYLPVTAYAEALQAEGLHIVQQRTAFTTALSLMWIVVAVKPAL